MPRFLVEYLLFHEMLHIKFPVERDGHRRIIHSRAFRAAERKFPHYERALRRLRQISKRGSDRLPGVALGLSLQ
jgi:predicted metal-dependent hydrolase